jgi:hypothetical protein
VRGHHPPRRSAQYPHPRLRFDSLALGSWRETLQETVHNHFDTSGQQNVEKCFISVAELVAHDLVWTEVEPQCYAAPAPSGSASSTSDPIAPTQNGFGSDGPVDSNLTFNLIKTGIVSYVIHSNLQQFLFYSNKNQWKNSPYSMLAFARFRKVACFMAG